MNWDWSLTVEILPSLLLGVWETILVTIVSSVIALTGGLVIAILNLVSGKIGRIFIQGSIEILRGIPILVLLFFGFYALPLVGIVLPAFFVGVIVLGGVYAAYCSEVYRGAIESIPSGMRDGSHALGLSKGVTWTKVLIPLAVKTSIPSLINYVIIIVKQSAFVFAIGVPVLLTRAQVAGYQSLSYLEPYTLAGILYLLLNIPLILLLRRYEVKFSG